jgi:uncharacterized membrane protein (UPF0127 family)
MRLCRSDRLQVIVGDVEVADSVRSRSRGLIGHAPLELNQALLIKPVRWIHTFGMSFPIDILYLNKEGRVVACSENLTPRRIDRPVLRARMALEMAAGAIRHHGVKVGDRLEILP